MSYQIINGKEIEIIDDYCYSDEPSLISSPKKLLFVDTHGNVHIEISERYVPKIKRSPFIIINNSIELISITGKRTIDDAFGSGPHDEERYGQTIEENFFEKNEGHGVIQEREKFYSVDLGEKPINTSTNNSNTKYDEEGIINWCYLYLASKNK